MRDGLEVLLERRGVRVAAATGTAAAAEQAIREHEPDVAIVDLQLPEESGLRLVQRLAAAQPELKILIYTGAEDVETLAEALESGASGLVLKAGGMDNLIDGLRSVARGTRFIDPAVRAIIEPGSEVSSRLLTPREREVFDLLAQGLTGEQIAARLELSIETIRTHIRNGMGKLDARTRTEAVVQALEKGEIGN